MRKPSLSDYRAIAPEPEPLDNPEPDPLYNHWRSHEDWARYWVVRSMDEGARNERNLAAAEQVDQLIQHDFRHPMSVGFSTSQSAWRDICLREAEYHLRCRTILLQLER